MLSEIRATFESCEEFCDVQLEVFRELFVPAINWSGTWLDEHKSDF